VRGVRVPSLARAAIALGWLASVACAPRLQPLTGSPAPRRLPRTDLAPGHRRVVFTWTFVDRDLEGRGEGAARLAAPDSARVDFFLAGGLGSGAAVLIGDDLRLPQSTGRLERQLVPPAPLLWAALGRAAVPPAPDTVARVDGDTLRVDIGKPAAWRLVFARDTLRRVERVDDGRIVESVARLADGHVRYRNAVSRRRLDLFVTRSDNASTFDATIWNP
jgi:hypothetical protein